MIKAKLGPIKLKSRYKINSLAMKKFIVPAGLKMQEHVIRNAPVDQGTLRRSIHVGGINGSSGTDPKGNPFSDIGGDSFGRQRARILVGTNIIYALMEHFGGFIVAKNAPRLFFFSKKAGSYVSADKVYKKPTNFMINGFHAGTLPAVNAIRSAVRRFFT